MEDRQRHGPAERARQREERARERHRAGATPGPTADRPHRTDRAPAGPPTGPPPGPSTPTTGAGAGAGTGSGFGTPAANPGRRAERPRRARGREPRLPGGRAPRLAPGPGAAPRPHPLLLPGALAAGGLLAVDLVLGLLDQRVVALQVLAVAAAVAAGVTLWRGVAATRRHGSKLASQLAETSVDADARQVATAGLVVNLARRNQSLVDRQLSLIGDMEQNESEPDALAELFQLDHIATRIRRHAESLLVLAGDESPARSWRHPVLLTEVARAAAAEVEDYQRVDVLVGDDVEVTGRVVADLAHLLAELVENATTYSPAERRVQVRSHTEPSGDATRPAVVVTVEDNGIGMTDADREATNRVLAEPMVLDLRGHTMGMHVVARLAHRYGLRVRLDATPGGGITALVTIPPDLVSERDPSRPARTSTLQRRPHFSPIAGAGPGAGPGAGMGGGPGVGTPAPITAARQLPAPSSLPPLPARTTGTAASTPATPAAPATSTPAAPAAAGPPVVAPIPLPLPAVAPAPTTNPAPGAGPAPTVAPVAPAATSPAPPGGGPTTGPGSTPAHDHGHSTVDREHVRSMLSRFQASQRAGRALADAPPGSLAPAPTPATATRPVSQEDS